MKGELEGFKNKVRGTKFDAPTNFNETQKQSLFYYDWIGKDSFLYCFDKETMTKYAPYRVIH